MLRQQVFSNFYHLPLPPPSAIVSISSPLRLLTLYVSAPQVEMVIVLQPEDGMKLILITSQVCKDIV